MRSPEDLEGLRSQKNFIFRNAQIPKSLFAFPNVFCVPIQFVFQDMLTDIKMEDYDFNNEIDDEQKFDLEEDQHICLICNTTFTLQEDLLRHVAAKHNIKFECIACNELFISNMELKVKILNTEVDSNK